METILEQQRRLHEERERLVKLMVDEYVTKKQSERDRIFSDHRLKALLELHNNSTVALKELYEDKDGERKSEGNVLAGPNEFSEFYLRLKQIEEFYKKHSNEISVPLTELYASNGGNGDDEMSKLVKFTDEEGCGCYLDLHECHEKYLNIRGIEKVDYITYLMTFDHVFDIPKECKNIDYKQYLYGLLEYLRDYVLRIKPLLDIEAELETVHKKFQHQWDNGSFPGWPKEQESALATKTGGHLDLSAFSSWEELASLGLDRLKSALFAINIKCGGSLEERAQRLFSTKGQRTIDPALLPRKDIDKLTARKLGRHRDIAYMEAQLYRFAELVSAQRRATEENVQRKQARTEREREKSDAEAEAEVSDSANEDDDADVMPYNPKNLPLNWDGKPIPYWLYKLHGLNISYICEICGNYTHKGPKAFQRHFAEWRHAHGMRCLGIPNTKHFANVTGIEDALTLWENLKTLKQGERYIPETEEEFEDSRGNVVNKKTYEDLKRQCLL